MLFHTKIETLATWFILALFFFLIAVGILRWAFRVNAIVDNLKDLNEKLGKLIPPVPVKNDADAGHGNPYDSPNFPGV